MVGSSVTSGECGADRRGKGSRVLSQERMSCRAKPNCLASGRRPTPIISQ
jgi:hypothetical protein